MKTPNLGKGGELPEPTHAYVGRCQHGHAYYVAVDDEHTDRPSLGLDIAQVIRDGGTIERVTIEQARETPLYRCNVCKDIRRNR